MTRLVLLAVLAALLVVGVFAGDTNNHWALCPGFSNPEFTVDSVTISPEIHYPGDNITTVMSGKTTVTTTAGTILVDIYLRNIKLFGFKYDFCTMNPDSPCPLNPGAWNGKLVQQTPTFAFPGDYTGITHVYNQDNKVLTCVQFNITIVKKPTAEELQQQRLLDEQTPALDDAMIAEINSANAGWRAARNPRFEGLSMAQAKTLLRIDPSRVFEKSPPLAVFSAPSVPTEFDWRKQDSTCVHSIRDQGQCGSCWAFGATEALSDRFCIKSKHSFNQILSPQYLVSCDHSNLGCQGGYLDRAWKFLESSGTCTESCFPYSSGGGSAPACPTKCKDGSALKLYKIKKGSIVTPSGVTSIQTSIMNDGPIEAAFTVYQDFFSYKSGVYQHKSGGVAGGHAIKIIGWGVEPQSNTPYWICANSWGTSWGLNGFFWILRGKNECGIEGNCIAGTPDI